MAVVLFSDELRRSVGLPGDCGSFDTTTNVWRVRFSDLERYRPDLAIDAPKESEASEDCEA